MEERHACLTECDLVATVWFYYSKSLNCCIEIRGLLDTLEGVSGFCPPAIFAAPCREFTGNCADTEEQASRHSSLPDALCCDARSTFVCAAPVCIERSCVRCGSLRALAGGRSLLCVCMRLKQCSLLEGSGLSRTRCLLSVVGCRTLRSSGLFHSKRAAFLRATSATRRAIFF